MAEAFYLPSGGGFEPTELTRGPWDPRAQHAGPPAALVGRAVELAGRDGLRTARITFDIPRPVPIAPLEVATRVVRGGRRVELVQASVRAGGEEVVRAVALRLRRAELALPGAWTPPTRPRRGPSTASSGRSSPPAPRSATTPPWSGASSAGRSWTRDRRRCGCACATRCCPASRPRRSPAC